MRRWVLGLTALLGGCEERLFLAIPEGTAWVTAVQEQDGVVSPSRLLRADGRTCVPKPPSGCRFDPEPGRHGVLRCSTEAAGDCEVRAHLDEGPRLRIERRLHVRDVPPRAAELLDGVAPDETFRLLRARGDLTDFVVLDDRLVAVGQESYTERALCHDGSSSLLYFVSKETPSSIVVRDAPGCVTDLHPTEDGRALLAAVQRRARPEQLEVLLLDREGNELARGAAPVSIRDMAVIDGFTLGSDGRGAFVAVAAEYIERVQDQGTVSHVVRVELEAGRSLRLGPVRRMSAVRSSQHRALGAPVPHQGLVALPDIGSPHGVVWLEPDDLSTRREWFADSSFSLGRRPHVLYAPEGRDMLLAAAVGSGFGVLALEDFELTRGARVYEAPGSQPFALTSWPADLRYALVVSFDGRAYASLFDLDEKHHVPGGSRSASACPDPPSPTATRSGSCSCGRRAWCSSRPRAPESGGDRAPLGMQPGPGERSRSRGVRVRARSMRPPPHQVAPHVHRWRTVQVSLFCSGWGVGPSAVDPSCSRSGSSAAHSPLARRPLWGRRWHARGRRAPARRGCRAGARCLILGRGTPRRRGVHRCRRWRGF